MTLHGILRVQADSSCSRQHAAIVHHQDGRTFVIDLQSVRIISEILCVGVDCLEHSPSMH